MYLPAIQGLHVLSSSELLHHVVVCNIEFWDILSNSALLHTQAACLDNQPRSKQLHVA